MSGKLQNRRTMKGSDNGDPASATAAVREMVHPSPTFPASCLLGFRLSSGLKDTQQPGISRGCFLLLLHCGPRVPLRNWHFLPTSVA